MNLEKLHKYKLERVVSFPLFPIICNDAAIESMAVNKYLDKFGYANKIVAAITIFDNYEGWECKQVSPEISKKEDILFFINLANNQSPVLEGKLKILIKEVEHTNRTELVKVIEKINNIAHDLYSWFSFYVNEYFFTDDSDIAYSLAQARMRAGNITATMLWDCYESVLNRVEKVSKINRYLLNRMFYYEVINILKYSNDLSWLKDVTPARSMGYVIQDGIVERVVDENTKKLSDYLRAQDPNIKLVDEFDVSKLFRGKVANRGKVCGEVVILKEKDYWRAGEVFSNKKDFILVTPMTRPEIVKHLRAAKAFITDEGGITCHAAIIARELKKPCIIGTKIATQVLQNGDLVEVDADKGVVRIRGW